MRLLLTLCLFFQYLRSISGQAQPLAGHSYQLYNQYSGDNPYEYLAWTTSSSEASGASSNDPGVYMFKSTDPAPRHALWTFELQPDGISYYVYNTDESYGSPERRLDVHSDGITPFLWIDGPPSQNPGQLWRLIPYNDGINFQIWNYHFGRVLDINGGGVANYPINGPFMNAPGSGLAGQKWQLGDSTPTTRVTTTVLSIQTSTVTPMPQTSTLQGTIATVTTTSTAYVTQTITVTATAATIVHRPAKRAYVLTYTVLSTIYSTSTSYTTLPTSTIYITSANTVVTSTSTTTSTILTTITTTSTTVGPNTSQPITSQAAPMTNSGFITTTSAVSSVASLTPTTPTTTATSSTDSPSSGLTNDQKIAVGVGVPSAIFALLSLCLAACCAAWRWR